GGRGLGRRAAGRQDEGYWTDTANPEASHLGPPFRPCHQIGHSPIERSWASTVTAAKDTPTSSPECPTGGGPPAGRPAHLPDAQPPQHAPPRLAVSREPRPRRAGRHPPAGTGGTRTRPPAPPQG